MLQRLTILITALLFGLFMFTACDDDSSVDPTPPIEDPNIIEAAEDDGDFTILLELAEEAGIIDVFASEELTVFAPTDDAFNAISDEVLESFDATQIIQILEFHLVEGAVASGDIAEQQDTESVQGELLLLQNDGSDVVVNGSANVTTANIEASNGMIHVIDEVLLPSQIRLAREQPNFIDALASDGNFDVLLERLKQAELITTLQFLGPFTGFPPTDDAFNALPDGTLDDLDAAQIIQILEFHLVEGTIPSGDIAEQQDTESVQGEDLLLQNDGSDVVVNGSANVLIANIETSNGMIHPIDELLLPSQIRLALEQPNFIDVALASEGDFDILLDAIEQAGLMTTFQFLGPFTGFAPSDDAFQEVDMESLDEEQLQDVLLYHVTDIGVITSDNLEPSQRERVTMMNGDELLITAGGDGVFLNEIAQVVLPDNRASNGVIHVIDQVLMPESLGGGAPAE